LEQTCGASRQRWAAIATDWQGGAGGEVMASGGGGAVRRLPVGEGLARLGLAQTESPREERRRCNPFSFFFSPVSRHSRCFSMSFLSAALLSFPSAAC